ncbi:integrase [Thalassotalea agarivorans]|uniref:Phage integrase family protein n=1 Tax=Thalassotalea agarivorans TaxID=349064 RepID=A0A1I0H4P9_THASX|nr:site-specific integrase [Thalassotalea agarivorans]SET78688.1 Phage integrase family protein [Thalassotalea agarivorans]
MATINIEKRKLKNGYSYRARVRITKFGKIIDKDEKTLKTREAAQAWAKKTEKVLLSKQDDIKNGTYFSPEASEKLKETTVGELINEYLKNPLTSKDLGRTKRYVLEALLNYDISQKIVSQLTANDLINHCQFRLEDETKPSPQTVYHDVTYLHSVIKRAKQVFKVNTNLSYHEEAIPELVSLKLIGRSGKRNRRPTREELRLLEEGLAKREMNRSSKIPFNDILQFSILSAMRVGELTKLRWSDLDHENKTIIVRDRKDPRRKENNDWEVPLLGEAYPIILKQKERIDPDNPNLIFPYNPRSISAGWQRVRSSLGIEDLRYHDLRREGASRLAEQGYDIRTVAKITGHKNLNILYDIYSTMEVKNFAKSEFEKYQSQKNSEV